MIAAIDDPILLSVSLIVHCITFVLNEAFSKKNKRKLNLMSTFAVGIAITALGNALLVYRIGVYGLNNDSMYNYIVIKYMNHAAALWAIGNTFVFIGYELCFKKSLPPLTVILDDKKIVDHIFKAALFLAVLSFTGNLVNLGFISGGLQKLLILFNEMSVLFFARLWGKEDSKKYRNYAIILCVFRALVALFQAFLRIELLEPFIVFFGGYFIGKGNARMLFSYRALPAIIVLVAFASIFGNLGSNRSHFIDAFRADNETKVIPSYVIASVQESDRGNVIIRGANIAQISNIFKLVERNGLYNGEASLPLLYAFIPRFLWPEKPTIELGTWFALEIGVATISVFTGRSNNSVNMSIPGELYLDFGWIGVILGCMGIGALLALMWNAAHFGDTYNIMGAMWGGYLMFFSLFGVGADLQIFITFISTYLVFLTVKTLLKPYANTQPRALVEG